jgi:FdhD protein
MNNSVEKINVKKISNGILKDQTDHLAVEEPLQINVAWSTASGRIEKAIVVTMRTPGNDEELAAGFLFTEGVISGNVISNIRKRSSDDNHLLVTLNENIQPVLNKTDRNFYSTSGCGICGKASIDAIRTISVYNDDVDDIINTDILTGLPAKLREHQQVFEDTGGIHASALFTLNGDFIFLREDVGRHNALDKVIGSSLLNNNLPLYHYILLLSGRASFELVQKAIMAGIKIIAAIGAPSTLAVELAKENNITLAGFLREGRFNVYSGAQRLKLKHYENQD